MRCVDCAGDFDDEGEWRAQCGTPIDPDGGEYYCCDGCGAALCDCCGGSINYHCPRHRLDGMFQEGREPEYIYPYAFGDGNQFTFGVEIETESEPSEDFMENVADSELIAGRENDQSLDSCGVELQSNILDMSKLSDLRHLIDGIPEYGEDAGGHIHVARTPDQCASRWYRALHGLDATQCQRLNMRHMSDDYWRELGHGDYCGKHVAINDEHQDTIELRTFDCWFEGSAAKLVPAVKWIRAMWRFFEKHPRGTVSADAIERYSSCMADNVTDTPRRTRVPRRADDGAAGARRVATLQASRTPRAERTLRADSQAYRVGQRLTTSLRGRERPAPHHWKRGKHNVCNRYGRARLHA